MTSSGSQISTRGAQLIAQPPVDEYILEDIARQGDSDPDDPERFIGLAIAENKLMWDLLEPRFNAPRTVEHWCIGYDDLAGSQEFRSAVASFTAKHLAYRDPDPDSIIALAGAGTILEALMYVIGDPGQGVLVPTPSYAGYWADIETRDAMTVVPAHMHPDSGFLLDTDVLEEAYTSSPVPLRALLVTNPVNPTGQILSPTEIGDAVSWARSRGLQIIMNEIYALSTFIATPFVSARSVLEDVADDIHFVWAFSKDFGMSGLRVGILQSDNESVIAAVREIAYWGSVSGDTQHFLSDLIGDDAFVTHYLAEMRGRLSESRRGTVSAMERANIPVVDSGAGLFILGDFRAFLAEQTWQAEHDLWRSILDEANVNLTPGASCHVGVPGFMRVCFAREPIEIVETAIERTAAVLASISN